MGKIKNVLIEIQELVEAGLSYDQIMACGEYPAEWVRQVIEESRGPQEPFGSMEFDDVPY